VVAGAAPPQLQPVQGALAGQCLIQFPLAAQNRKQRVQAQLLVVVQILMAQRQTVYALRQHLPQPMLHQLLLAPILKTVRQATQQACAWSHFLGRALREQGHDGRLMPAQYVKPYVKTNKYDYIDAEAIAEAVTRPSMRFVPIKTDDQLDLQSLYRVRERWVGRRTAVINQIRGLLVERGITVSRGLRHIEESLPSE
jgi:hypothetical protein